MTTQLNESFDQAYTEEHLLANVAGSAANEEASGGQSRAEDCAAVPSVTFTESPFEKSNFCVYRSGKKHMNVQHFLQAISVIIGRKRYRI